MLQLIALFQDNERNDRRDKSCLVLGYSIQKEQARCKNLFQKVSSVHLTKPAQEEKFSVINFY